MSQNFEFNIDEFLRGESLNSYKYFGCHKYLKEELKESGFVFRVFAPHAKKVYVLGQWNNFDKHRNEMNKIHPSGVFELFIPNIEEFVFYQYLIVSPEDEELIRIDAYSFLYDFLHKDYSKTYDINSLEHKDTKSFEDKELDLNRPISIYEMDIFNFKRKEDGSYFSYDEIGDEIIPYLDDLGFKAINFLNKNVSQDKNLFVNFYSLNTVLGTPKQFQDLIINFHKNNYEIILNLDFHSSYFSSNLIKFDGTCMFECQNDKENKPRFDFSKGYVRSYLISSIMFMIEYYHIDGIKIHNIDKYYSNESEKVFIIKFIKDLNKAAYGNNKQIISIGENKDNSLWLTKMHNDSLNFNLKIDNTFTETVLDFWSKDLEGRKLNKESISSSMMNFFKENHLISFPSGTKKSLINFLDGDLLNRLEELKNIFVYMFSHPGKKLIYMGNEIGNIAEYDSNFIYDPTLINKAHHQNIYRLVKDLNLIYKYEKALWYEESNSFYFHWIDVFASNPNVFVFNRKVEDSVLIFVFNISKEKIEHYQLPLNEPKKITEIINSCSKKYGGDDFTNPIPIQSISESDKIFADIKVGPLAGIIFKVN